MSLKLVAVSSPDASVRERIAGVLAERAGGAEVRRLGDAVFIVETDAPPSDVRDWLAPLLSPEDALIVVEFERWSSRGTSVDAAWLRRRGH
ncbi:MAG: hypothetical protein WEC75_12990 [Dehalococcoidia bacterium]